MAAFDWIRLTGPSSRVSTVPQACEACGCKEFFQQPDFRRSLGMWVVSAACLATIALAATHANWWVTWSPMPAIILVDFLFFKMSPTVLVCYNCEHRYRGLPGEALKDFEAFDLEVFDRHQYAEAHKVQPSP